MTLREVQIECDMALQRLEKLFKPHCRLTLLMRNPQSDDGNMLFTKDDLELVEAAILRERYRDEMASQQGVVPG